MSKKVKLAIFDIDGTIFRSSLFIELTRAMIEEGVLPKKASDKIEKEYTLWTQRKGNYSNYIKKVVEVYFDYIEGLKKEEVDKIVKEVLSSQKEKVYRFIRDLFNKLKKDGKYHLIAISGSPFYMVREFGKFMGFDYVYGTENIIENGIIKREVRNKNLSKDGVYKEPILLEYLSANKIDVNWKDSIAVGDTESDISILKMVGKPIAFNPNEELAKHAKKNKWRIVVERKDVIYDIGDFKFIRHHQ